MALADLLNRLTNKSAKAGASFDTLCVAAVEGEKVTVPQAEAACAAAGMPLDAFTSHVAMLQRRRDAWQAAYGRDWAAERKAIVEPLKEAAASIDAVANEIEVLRQELSRLHEHRDQLQGALRRFSAAEVEAKRHCEQVLRRSGGPDDWRDLGEPQPRPKRRRPQPGEENLITGHDENGKPYIEEAA